MPMTAYHSIAAAYGTIAFIHVWLLLRMLCVSARRHQCTFTVTLQVHESATGHGIVHSIHQFFATTNSALFSQTGLLGVSGPCFNLLLFEKYSRRFFKPGKPTK